LIKAVRCVSFAGVMVAALLLLTVLSGFLTVQGETSTARFTFSPADKFNIPALNSSISFAVNGTYRLAKLDNNMWTFYDLRLNGSRVLGNLGFSAQNSNVTIRMYSTFNYTDVNTRIGYILYDIKGHGTQTIDLGLNTTQPSEPYQWTITTGHNIFLVSGDGWTLYPNGTITMLGAMNNASLSRYGYTVDRSQHSVSITVGILTVCTVAVAATITLVNRKRRLNKNAL
jgi:hypothetical protein